MSGRRRGQGRTGNENLSALSIVSTGDMERIREELQRVSAPGTDPLERAAVLTWVLQYSASYFKTARGNLRRVFPKGKASINF